MDLCHVPESQRHQVDGTSFVNILNGDTKEIHDHLFFEIGATRAVLKDGWKYLAFRLPNTVSPNPPEPYTHLADRPGGRGSEGPAKDFYPNYYDMDQLYDIRSDPLEHDNRIADPSQKSRVEFLKALLKKNLANVPGSFAEFTDKETSN